MKNRRFALNTNIFRKKLTSAQIAALSRRIGLDGIEWGLPSVDESAAAAREMAQVTADEGLQIASFINAGHLWKTDLMRRFSDAIAPVGGTMLRVAHPWLAWDYRESLHQPDAFMDLFKKAREGLERLVPLAREYGIRYVLETHRGSVCASPVTCRFLLEGLDPKCVGIIYDPANTVLEGFIRPRGAVEALGPYLAYLHVKNLLPFYTAETVDGPHRRMTANYQYGALDGGAVDYLEVCFALNLARFDGWLSFEEFFADDSEAKLSAAFTALKAYFAAAPTAAQEPFNTFNA